LAGGGRTAIETTTDPGEQEVEELPRTTTTGDSRNDVRQPGDGAVDDHGSAVRHGEDERLDANLRGFIAAWRERLSRLGRS
jgi:hypothetical protein